MKPLSYVYESATDLKNRLFAQNFFKIHKVSVPVVSIGNLTVGGTGKTPFVDYTVKYFSRKNKKVGVISRAYKAQAREPVKVDCQVSGAGEKYGDEPVWLARQNPQASVFSGRTKWRIAEWAVAHEQLDLLILDDGFQHRYLHRDLDIVLLDATEAWENYQVLPAGRAREKWSGLERADIVVLSKCNWAPAKHLEFLKTKIPKEKKIVELASRVERFHEFRSGQVETKENFRQSRCMLFCSIARPDVFKQMMSAIFQEVDILAFPDHHLFTSDDIESILAKMRSRNCAHICCTEKDAVKLKDIWPSQQNLWVSELEIQVMNGEGELHAAFDQLCS